MRIAKLKPWLLGAIKHPVSSCAAQCSDREVSKVVLILVCLSLAILSPKVVDQEVMRLFLA